MKYGAILIDPPWRFNVWSGETPVQARASKSTYTSARVHYETMSPEEIIGLPVMDLAADNCVLFCWACWPTFPLALEAIEAWGFTYKTMGFVWVKGEGLPLFPEDIRDQMGMGYWSRANTEPCILATRGKPKRKAADVRQVILDRRRQHSRKPDEIYSRIERLVDGPYLEMFARQQWPGWDVWGNETNKFQVAV